MIFCPATHTSLSSGCCTSLCRADILSLTVKVNDMGNGVSGPPLPTHSHPVPISHSSPLLIHSLSQFPSPHLSTLSIPVTTPPPSFTQPCPPHPHNTNAFFFCLCAIPFLITKSLHRSAVAVHCCGVPVHPPAGHRRHPHVHRGVSLWQCHRRPQAQRLRCHIHCALR